MADRLDRVRPPDPLRPRRGRPDGKRALYSVDTEAHPTVAVYVGCRRCGVEQGLTGRRAIALLRPPMVLLGRRIWARCPACGHLALLDARWGPGIPRIRA